MKLFIAIFLVTLPITAPLMWMFYYLYLKVGAGPILFGLLVFSLWLSAVVYVVDWVMARDAQGNPVTVRRYKP